MQTDAFIGLILICAIIIPAMIYLILRGITPLKQLAVKWWWVLYAIAFIAQPIFLFRKLWEGALVLTNPSSLTLQLIAQADNAWWEELAKLLALLLIIWLARDRVKPFFSKLSTSINLGLWTGLAYGAGEAVILGILFVAPNLAPIFGLHTFSPFTFGWEFVLERIWAMQLHAIMGALIGAGVWCWYSSKRGGFITWFIVAMLYHDFVDGQIILAQFNSALASFLTQFGITLLPIDVALGYLLIILVYRVHHRSRAAQRITPQAQSSN
jgi:hypothetical protein